LEHQLLLDGAIQRYDQDTLCIVLRNSDGGLASLVLEDNNAVDVVLETWVRAEHLPLLQVL